MGTRIGCCLNLPPPTPTQSYSSFPSKTSQLQICSKRKSGEVGSRRLPCAVGVMIGLEMIIMSSSSSINYGESRYDVVVREEQAVPSMLFEATSPRPPKWSDTIRTCPPWRVNSLESIVPENLPRPSARRRSEAAGYAAGAADAPAVKFAVGRATGDCFSM